MVLNMLAYHFLFVFVFYYLFVVIVCYTRVDGITEETMDDLLH